MTFKDYFSKTASDYAIYRPHYPTTIFTFLNTIVEEHRVAWDCATGNGQVANQLVHYFNQVYASDASEKQISYAQKNERINYFVSLAESTPLEANSVDLITVAQAFHWFNKNEFWLEVKRLLKPKGIIAIWGYGLFEIPEASDALNSAVQQLYDAVKPFWPLERQFINTEYKTLSFPFNEISTPNFSMTHYWTVKELIGYLTTWSATQKYIKMNGQDRLFSLMEGIAKSWPVTATKMMIYWPLFFRVGS